MAQEERKMRKRLSMDIPIEIYKEMRISTVNRNCTVTKWVLRAVVEELKKERGRCNQSVL